MVFLAKKIGDITTDDILVGVMAFFVIAIVGLIAMWVWKKKIDRANSYKPVESQEARVVELQQFAPGTIVFAMWIMFELSDGRRIRVTTKPNHSLVAGDQGVLTWQGSNMLSFRRN